MFRDIVFSNKVAFSVGRNIPSWLLRLYAQYIVRPGVHWLKKLEHSLSMPDRQHLLIYGPDGALIRLVRTSCLVQSGQFPLRRFDIVLISE